jgi:site-specific recombinase XerD
VEWCSQIRLIPFKKILQPAITCLDQTEMNALLAAPERSTPQGQREHALLLFLYNSGARASEAAQLTIRNLDWHGRCVELLGKGGKRRTCPLWPATLTALRLLVADRDAAQRVFLNRVGQPIVNGGLEPRNFAVPPAD